MFIIPSAFVPLVCETKSPSMSDFLTGLENSGWLRHIKAVMDAGVFLAKVRPTSEFPKIFVIREMGEQE